PADRQADDPGRGQRRLASGANPRLPAGTQNAQDALPVACRTRSRLRRHRGGVCRRHDAATARFDDLGRSPLRDPSAAEGVTQITPGPWRTRGAVPRFNLLLRVDHQANASAVWYSVIMLTLIGYAFGSLGATS